MARIVRFSARRLVVLAASLLLLGAALSCEMLGVDDIDRTGTLSLKIRGLESLVSESSKSSRAIGFVDRVSLNLFKTRGESTFVAAAKTFDIEDGVNTVSLEWEVPVGMYSGMIALIYNLAVSDEFPIVLGSTMGGREEEGIEVKLGVTTSVSIECAPGGTEDELYPSSIDGSTAFVNVAAGGETWLGLTPSYETEEYTMITVVPGPPEYGTIEGSSRVSNEEVGEVYDYLVGVYGREGASGFLAGGAFTQGGRLFVDTEDSFSYFVGIATRSAASFQVKAEGIALLTDTEIYGQPFKEAGTWYAVTVPQDAEGKLYVTLGAFGEESFIPDYPYSVSIYGTDGRMLLGEATQGDVAVTASSATDVEAGKTYFIYVEGGGPDIPFDLIWEVAQPGTMDVILS